MSKQKNMEKKNYFNNPFTGVLVNLILLALLVLGIAGSIMLIKVATGTLDTERDTVTIMGEGRVTAQPDLGKVTVTIVTERDTAEEAQEENITQFNQVVVALKEVGIKEEDLQTTSFNVNPLYDYTDNGRVSNGYEVRQSVEVTIRDLEKSGDVIQAAGNSGANQVSGLSFTIDEPEQYREEARQKALENAKQKADELSRTLGVKLGKIVSFSEYSNDGNNPVPFYGGAMDMAAESVQKTAVPAPQLETGSQDVYVTATIVFEVK